MREGNRERTLGSILRNFFLLHLHRPVGEMGRQQASPTILGATVGKHLLDEWNKGVEQRKNFCTSPQELRSNEGHGTN